MRFRLWMQWLIIVLLSRKQNNYQHCIQRRNPSYQGHQRHVNAFTSIIPHHRFQFVACSFHRVGISSINVHPINGKFKQYTVIDILLSSCKSSHTHRIDRLGMRGKCPLGYDDLVCERMLLQTLPKRFATATKSLLSELNLLYLRSFCSSVDSGISKISWNSTNGNAHKTN